LYSPTRRRESRAKLSRGQSLCRGTSHWYSSQKNSKSRYYRCSEEGK